MAIKDRRNTIDSAPSLKNLNTVRSHRSNHEISPEVNSKDQKYFKHENKNHSFIVGSFENFDLTGVNSP